ncbi:TetR/AcrR family transcriptional regulator [Nonomuraea zeae]|uniref:TetR/AcrR family transcriptional regulator n=1 Tax=Nonomuraea zeae TaxID=1642303 RepID=A0A5S4GD64_9ACTN|nr:TetR/AcrR family transcriptional regulator [Nonomuraea zeae]TMR30943.1 TetR/AcrR family transcriptional regulator [Nonomuraea zeae]
MARRSPAPEERQRDGERTKRLIIEAGTREFAQKGYAGARVAAIAERAGVNVQLISYYFGGKAGLYQEIARGWREREAAQLAAQSDLAEIVKGYVTAMIDDPHTPKLLAWEGLSHGDDVPEVEQAERNQRLRDNLGPFEQGRRDGTIDPRFDPACLELILIAAGMAPVVYPQLVEGLCGARADDPEFLGRFAEQLALLVRHLGGTESPKG